MKVEEMTVPTMCVSCDIIGGKVKLSLGTKSATGDLPIRPYEYPVRVLLASQQNMGRKGVSRGHENMTCQQFPFHCSP